MPLEYTIDPSRRLVIITGEYGDDVEWRDVLERVGADPDYAAGFSFLRDLRNARHPVTPQVVARIVAVVREAWPLLQPRRAAMVAPRDLESPVMVAHALADDAEIPLRAFTSYDAALEWLAAK